MSKNILFVIFAYLDNEKAGPGKIAFSLINKFIQNGVHVETICLGHNTKIPSISSYSFFSPPHSVLYKIMRKAFYWLHKIGVVLPERQITEAVFDFFTSISGALRRSECIVFLKPTFPISVCAAKKLKIPTMGISTILHPIFNAIVIKKEKYIIGSRRYSPFTDKIRINRKMKFFQNVDCIYTMSLKSRDLFIKYGGKPDKIHKIADSFGVFMPNLVVKKENIKLTFLHVSYVSLIKGIRLLLSAWAKACTMLPDCKLVIAGKQDSDSKLLINKLAVPGIEYCEKYSYEEIYSRGDVFISPSVSDCTPETVLEAMSFQLPVIISQSCGLSEIIQDGIDGFIYDTYDLDKLVEILIWFNLNRHEIEHMGMAACNKASKYSTAYFASKVFERVCS
jgi:glycosyltransferase involved in cell wall biosynthesis